MIDPRDYEWDDEEDSRGLWIGIALFSVIGLLLFGFGFLLGALLL
jgi:hypothetical protein